MRESINNLFPDSPIWNYKGSVLFATLLGATIAAIWFTIVPPTASPIRYERQWFFIQNQPLRATPLGRQHEVVKYFHDFAEHYNYTYNERRDSLKDGGFWFYHSSTAGSGFVVAQESTPYLLGEFAIRLNDWALGPGLQMMTDAIVIDNENQQTVLERRAPGIASFEAGVMVGAMAGGIVGVVYSFVAAFLVSRGRRPFGVFS